MDDDNIDVVNRVDLGAVDEDLSSSRSSDYSLEDQKANTNHSQSEEESKLDSSNPEGNLDRVLGEIPEYYEKGSEGFYTWEIDDIGRLVGDEKVFGPKFNVGGSHVFNALITTVRRQNTSFSVYLEGHPSDPKEAESEDWHCCVQFALDVWDPERPALHKMNSTHFRYNSRVTDWGFINLLDSHFPADADMIEKKRLNITAYVRIIKDFTGVLWHDFIDYDSKKSTGYVGINNQGATCYLNSLLQSYYFTKKFRKKVYQIPTEDEIKFDSPSFKDYLQQPKSVSLSLQRIFYNLQTSDKPIDTMELTSSFGWTSADAFTQHDVQEMNRILMDKLESKMKHTDIEGCLNDIFVGKMRSFIRCIDVKYESSRIEDFWDIQLNVKGLKNIKESFQNYVELELLDGENKYDAAGYGLQTAEKGVVFESFPPVLHLQLKRFEYDFEYDQLVKINDRYEFFDTLDLKEYMNKDSEHYDEDWEYKLHCVLVHQGDVSMGHYYAMIKPNDEDKWLRFDDDKVWRVTPNEVFEGNFGADQPTDDPRKMSRDEQQDFQLRRHTSAYMLVYVRKSRVPEILAEVEKKDIPPHIPKQINYEREQLEKFRKEQEEMHLYANFKVFHNDGFSKFQGFDLGPNEKDRYNYCQELYDESSFPLKFRLLKSQSFSEVYDTVIRELGGKLDPQLIRFWIVSSRKNYASRPYEVVDYAYGDNGPSDVTIDSIINEYEIPTMGRRRSSTGQSIQLTLYLEDASKELKFVSNSIYDLKSKGKLQTEDPKLSFEERYERYSELCVESYKPKLESVGDNASAYLILLKFFDLPGQTIKGVSHVIVPSENPIEYLTPLLNNVLGFPMDTVLKFYEELGSSQIVPLISNRTFYKSEMSDGDIICFSKSDWGDLTASAEFKTAEDLYSFLANRLRFRVSPLQKVGEDEEEYVTRENSTDGKRSPEDGPQEPFEIWFSIASGYNALAKKIGEKVGVDPIYLRLFVGHASQNFPLKSTSVLEKLLERVPKSQTLEIRFEVLSVTLTDFEHMTLCKVYWVGQGICREQKHEFFLPRSSTLDDLLDRLQSKVHFKPEEKDSLLCWTMDSKHKFSAICDGDTGIDQSSEFIIGNYPAYREVIRTKPTNIRLITGFQFFGQLQNAHSIPFVFDLVKGEQFKDTKVRLHKLLGVSKKEFEGIRIAVTDMSMVEYMDSPERDNLQLFNFVQNMPFYLAVDHPDRNLRRTSAYEPSIYIRD
ncbi:DEKNAAC101685 [Brettanomyces naardenensis]|uniref:ubiquitinyl hydrolase 1 n=1 Tax=Brettanomyces naardenensis TaxID=13370 RepID=A0A448YJ55_BRENA|nr:DEKNAAC101685 [Brettanomyces naardenensis]